MGTFTFARPTMRISALCLILAAAFASADIYQKWGHDPDIDPLGKHCFDITVDLSDPRGGEWKNGNEWKYTSWKDGLCDNKTWPVVEEDTHLDGISSVTFRKSGHKAAGNATTELAWAGASKDCRTDKTSKPTSIDFTNAAKDKTKIRGCQNQYACKPYVDCELDLAPGASETIVIDSSFKYFIFTFYNAEESELYPDYNMKYPAQYSIKEPTVQALADEAAGDDYVIYQESPGNHAHCTQISFSDGKNNPYYKAHGYQYQPPVWTAGACPAKYNWFNKNETIAPGVVESLRGVHT